MIVTVEYFLEGGGTRAGQGGGVRRALPGCWDRPAGWGGWGVVRGCVYVLGQRGEEARRKGTGLQEEKLTLAWT